MTTIRFNETTKKFIMLDNETAYTLDKTIVSHGTELYCLPTNSTGRKFIAVSKVYDGLVLQPKTTTVATTTQPKANLEALVDYLTTEEEKTQFKALLAKIEKNKAKVDLQKKIAAMQAELAKYEDSEDAE